MNYNVLIEEFCKAYGLGEVREAHLLQTGNVNRTYVVETITGKYIIKAINPSRVKTEDDINRLEITEHIAELTNQSGITSISAKVLNGKVVNMLHEQHYIVFDFFEGKIIHSKNITTQNCFKIGQLLANLHSINFKALSDSNFDCYLKKHNYGGQLKSMIDWKDYFKKASEYNPEWLNLFEENLDVLYDVFKDSSIAYLSFIPQDIVIAHGDLFNHNVMWKDNVPHIIDWEQSCFIDATYDCLYTAIRWATIRTNSSEKSIDKDKLLAFLKGYVEVRSLNVENLEISLYMILYKRVTFLRRNFAKYFNSKDEISKKRVEREIRHTLSVIKSNRNLIDQLKELKQQITELQPDKQYKKSPSYEIIPKIEQLIKHYDAQTRELNHVKKWAVGLKVFQKMQKVYKESRR